MSRVCRMLLVLPAVFLLAVSAPEARAADGEAIDGPVFLVISLNGGTFASADFSCKCKKCAGTGGTCHDNRCGCKKPHPNGVPKCCQNNCSVPAGSPIIIIPIGEFLAGYAVDDTRLSQSVSTLEALLDALEALEEDLSFLGGAQYTILGAIDTSGPNTVHLLTEDEGEIADPVQDAFFEAQRDLEGTLTDGDPTNDPTTTTELADYIQTTQDSPSTGAGVQDIYDELFVEPADSTLTYTEGSGDMLASVDAEGSIFPHDPDDPVLDFELAVDEDGNIVIKTSMPNMTIDVKPGSDTNPINTGSNGVIPVAILSTFADVDNDGLYEPLDGDTIKFDAPDWVDPSTATIFGVYAAQWAVEDVNGDNVDDIILHFDTQELVDAGLSPDTTELEMLAEGFENEAGFRVGSFRAADPVDAFYNQG